MHVGVQRTGDHMRNLKGFYILLFVVSLALVWILLPFFSAIFWGTILAVLFQPLQRRLTVTFGNRPNIAALTTLALCVLIVILPVGLLVGTVAQEATFAYGRGRVETTFFALRQVSLAWSSVFCKDGGDHPDIAGRKKASPGLRCQPSSSLSSSSQRQVYS
jgi:hypothetical protein